MKNEKLENFLQEFDIDDNLIELLFKGDESFFLECLNMFLEDNNITGLQKALSDSDYTKAFEHAHALKGVSATLGLRGISKGFDRFVNLYRTGEYNSLFDNWFEIEKKIDKLKLGAQKYIKKA